jgi:hypothetical protein
MISAIAACVYTVGTFLLWWVTKKGLRITEKALKQSEDVFKQSEDAFKLSFLTNLIESYRPVYGAQNESFKNDEWVYNSIKDTSHEFIADLIKKTFPKEEADRIIQILLSRKIANKVETDRSRGKS